MKNLNLLFHKLYYDKIGNTASGTDKETKKIFAGDVNARNQEIFASEFIHEKDFLKCEDIPKVSVFPMKTKYPGLLIGTGYPHGSSRADDDIKCGFSFDYVSGQPYIPGSSVKGVLRSHFTEHPEAVAAIAEISENNVKALEKNIFDCGDIFLDAVLYDGDRKNRVLGREYITPHSEKTKNPNPIPIMKVLPDVRFEFRFIVSDFKKDSFTFTKNQKIELFKTLLSLFGIGAKTNVGYGMLEFDDSAPRTALISENQTETGTFSESEKVKCPHCGFFNFKYNRKGEKATRCFKCKENLYSEPKFKNSSVNSSEKVICPHCGWENFKYNKQGVKNTKCFNYNCKKDLPF